MSDVARKWSCSRRHVHRLRGLVAESTKELQLKFLHNCKAVWTMVLAAMTSSAWAYSMSNVRWDETSERLHVPIDSRLQRQQEHSSWHVLVQRRAAVCGVLHQNPGPRSALEEKFRFCTCISPVVPLVGVSASAIFDGLYNHPRTRPIAQAVEGAGLCRMIGSRRFAFFLFEADDASSNDKLIHHRYSQILAENPEALVEHKRCSLHQSSLTETTICFFMGVGLVNSLFSISSLLRTHGYFIRTAGLH